MMLTLNMKMKMKMKMKMIGDKDTEQYSCRARLPVDYHSIRKGDNCGDDGSHRSLERFHNKRQDRNGNEKININNTDTINSLDIGSLRGVFAHSDANLESYSYTLHYVLIHVCEAMLLQVYNLQWGATLFSSYQLLTRWTRRFPWGVSSKLLVFRLNLRVLQVI